jgi:hypothetical protein
MICWSMTGCAKPQPTSCRKPSAQRRGISLRTINRQKQLIRDGHLYQHFRIETDDILATTMWIFNWMGLRVRKRDLGLMLCWHWS